MPALNQASASPYTKDVAYTSRFGVLQSPIHLKFAAGLRGWAAPDPARPFTYIDIACGNGQSLIVLAAAYPHGEFIGFDFNAGHVAAARAKIAAAELDNVTVTEGDVLNLEKLVGRPFDFASIVGAYAWLTPERRRSVRSFLRKRANQGALVLLDYAANPGSGAASLLYEIARRKAGSLVGDSANRLQAVVTALKADAADGARFFKHYPTALSRLEDMARRDLADEAHEVFNLAEGLWFDDVADDMQSEGFSWANTARLTHAYPEFVLPSPLRRAPVPDTRPVQLDLDIALNTAYRADVFIAPAARQTCIADVLQDTLLLGKSGSVTKRLNNLLDKAPWLDASAFKAALGAFRDEQCSVRDMMTAIAAVQGDGNAAIGRLIAASVVQPLLFPMSSSIPQTGQWNMPLKYNRLVIEEDIGALYPRPLASPIAGTSLMLPLIDRLTLLPLLGGDLHAAYTSLQTAGIDTVDSFGHGLAAFEATLHKLAQRFEVSAARDLIRLGILTRE